MNKYIGIFSSIALLALAGACSKESPFDTEDEVLTGQLSTKSLLVEIKNEEKLVRADVDAPDVNDFTVEIVKAGETEPTLSYTYSKLPEILTLPIGEYSARAYYGENPAAAFDAPYFYGATEAFNIEADKITADIDPIVCKLSNVKVTVIFAESLASVMSPDSKVTVSVGKAGSEGGSLMFANGETRKGYFAYVEGSNTLGAVFEGEVEGAPTVETKAYDNVAPGNHYRLTFSLRSAGEGDPGSINGSIKVDATVEVVDINTDVDAPEEEVIEDDMRPVEGGEDPGPDQPGPDDPGTEGPTVSAVAPFDLDVVNDVTSFVYNEENPEAGDRLIVNVHSDTGITGFIVDIDSPKLPQEVLAEFGLSTHMDLINPASTDMEDGLTNLGLPFGDQVKGKNDVPFEISKFMGVLSLLGSDIHKFKFTVTDANGTVTKTLTLKN